MTYLDDRAETIDNMIVLAGKFTEMAEALNSMEKDKYDRVLEVLRETKPVRPGYLRREEAAFYIGTSPQFLKERYADGTGPKCIELSPKCKVYKISDLEKWVDSFPHRGGGRR